MRAREFVNEDLTRRGFLRGLGAATMAGAAGSALAQNTDISAAFKNMQQDDPRVRHAKDVADLANAIYQNMVAERGQPMDRRQQNTWMEIAHEKAAARFSQYRPGAQPPAAGFPSQGSEYRRSRDINNFESVEEGSDKKQSVRRIQKMLNHRFKANLDVDGVLGPLTQKTINQFMPSARPGSADQPNRTTAVQGKTVKDHNVREAFDKPYKGKWEKSDYGDVDLNTKLPDGTNLNIMFNQEFDGEHTVTQVEFHRNNSQDVTGEGDAQRIFATVLDAIQKYIKKYKPEKLSFSASKQIDMDADDVEHFNPESRAKLYTRLVQRYAAAWGYQAQVDDEGDIVIYQLTRQDLAEQQLDELSFLGSECTKDCSGHRAGYDWSKRKGLRQANSWSPSFNKGAGLAVAGK